MLLKEKSTGQMVKVLDLDTLFDLFHAEVKGRYQRGEEEGDAETFKKTNLVFLSGEALPRCWTDPHYRDQELER